MDRRSSSSRHHKWLMARSWWSARAILSRQRSNKASCSVRRSPHRRLLMKRIYSISIWANTFPSKHRVTQSLHPLILKLVRPNSTRNQIACVQRIFSSSKCSTALIRPHKPPLQHPQPRLKDNSLYPMQYRGRSPTFSAVTILYMDITQHAMRKKWLQLRSIRLHWIL